MRKRSNGFVYHLRWDEPNTPQMPNVQIVLKTCSKCLRTLTFEDRNTCFGMDEDFDSDLLQFQNINQASRATGFCYYTLWNAHKKVNMKIMRGKNEKSSICTGQVYVFIV